MKRSFLLFISFIFSVSLVMAQGGQSGVQGDILETLLEGGSGDRVNVEVDNQLVSNYNKLITKNMKSSGIPGYRIRIYSGSGIGAKEKQQKVRARFLSLYRGLDAYNQYDEPFFKVYVGDCRTRSEALKLNDMIKKDFPDPFIVPGYINVKSAD
ncbi:MAG: SPOR domain-containing protein [Bacteroidales bacterium]|nr:SPOR domain-containing protein [Bacteroidales bacterium]